MNLLCLSSQVSKDCKPSIMTVSTKHTIHNNTTNNDQNTSTKAVVNTYQELLHRMQLMFDDSYRRIDAVLSSFTDATMPTTIPPSDEVEDVQVMVPACSTDMVFTNTSCAITGADHKQLSNHVPAGVLPSDPDQDETLCTTYVIAEHRAPVQSFRLKSLFPRNSETPYGFTSCTYLLRDRQQMDIVTLCYREACDADPRRKHRKLHTVSIVSRRKVAEPYTLSSSKINTLPEKILVFLHSIFHDSFPWFSMFIPLLKVKPYPLKYFFSLALFSMTPFLSCPCFIPS